MQGLSTFAAAVHGVGPALASVALISALAAQEPRKRLPPPKPSSQCYAIRPDTGSRPWFLPEHLVLGANPVGDIGFRAAAVSPDRIRETYPDREDTLYARWSAYGRLFPADSIYVEWSFAQSIYGPIGELYARVHGDSLSGRAMEHSDALPAVIPWLPIHGRSEACPPGP